MSFFGRLFGTEKALTSVIDGVSKGLDSLVYTDEEKAKAASRDRSEARKMVVSWMQATQGQNLARRILALSIGFCWLSMHMFSSLISALSVFANDNGNVTAEKLQAVAKIAESSASNMTDPVMLILSFYFAAPHMSDLANAVIGRYKKK